MNGTITKVAFLFWLLFAFAFASIATENNNKGQDTTSWKAGVAHINITPDRPIWQGGYASREHVSEGKLTELWAKALAIQDASGKKAVLVTMDLIGISKSMSEIIKKSLKDLYGLSDDQIILNASHTHSGPALVGNLQDIYPMNSQQWEDVEQYCANLENKIVEVAGMALGKLHPVKIYSGNGVTRFQVNRRNNSEQDLVYQSELKGPNDHAVPVLKIVGKKDKLEAVVFGYACHGTVLSGHEISGDYMGFAQMEIEKSCPRTIAMFFQGAAGDQNPLPRRSIALAKQYGSELACAVKRVLEEEMMLLAPELKTAYTKIELEMENPPGEKELLEKSETASGYEQRWAKRLLNNVIQGKELKKKYSYPIEVWKLGNQLLFAMGGEPTIKYAIELKQRFGQDVFVMGYSNDVMAYIPSARILEEGGYEGDSSQRVYGLPSKWKPGVEETVLNGIVKLANSIGVEVKN